MSFNKITIVGNLGRDPELRYTPQGNAVADFSVATNEKRRDKDGEMQDVTTWFRVTVWGRQAEIAAQHLKKGRQVYIDGVLRLEEWTDKDGNNRATLEVTARDMQFIGGREVDADDDADGDAVDSAAAETEAAPKGKKGKKGSAPSDDDIPF